MFLLEKEAAMKERSDTGREPVVLGWHPREYALVGVPIAEAPREPDR